MKKYDIVLLTDDRFSLSVASDRYAENVILEDELLLTALEQRGLNVFKTHWNNPDFDWPSTRYAMIRTTWDIYDEGKFKKFEAWLSTVKTQTRLINDYTTIRWNIDKHYLQDLKSKGIKIPPTLFIPQGETRTLQEILAASNWRDSILKPAISGGGRHTYKIKEDNIHEVAHTFSSLIKEEAMLLQEFQHHVIKKGELSLMVFGGKYSHAVLKKAKKGDFRVQDDFGGTVHEYEPSREEIAFAERVVSACDPLPTQARVDFIWDNEGELCVSELELIEPELWFRRHQPAAHALADTIIKNYF